MKNIINNINKLISCKMKNGIQNIKERKQLKINESLQLTNKEI